MALKVTGETVWVARIKDKPGRLAKKLTALAEAGAQLAFLIARRAPDKPGKGVVFITPLKGAKQLKAAKKAGFRKSESLNSVRTEGPDAPGAGARVTQALAAACINLRGLSAAVIGKRFVAYVAVDSAADARKAMRVLRKL